jgi:hypothetical protein
MKHLYVRLVLVSGTLCLSVEAGNRLSINFPRINLMGLYTISFRVQRLEKGEISFEILRLIFECRTQQFLLEIVSPRAWV